MVTVDRARRVLGVVFVALAVAVAGCGNDARDRYKEDYKRVVAPVARALGTSTQRVEAAKTLNKRLVVLDKARRALDTAAGKLKKLDPPSEAQAEHDRFVKVLERYAADIRAYELAVRRGDARGVRRSLDALGRDPARLKQANEALAEKVG